MAALLTAGAGYLLMHRLQTESIQSIQQTMDTWRVALTLLRWGVIAVVAFSWSHVVQRLSASGKLSSVQAEYLTGLRWRAVTWLIILELVLGQGMVVKFFDIIAGTNSK
ncbi:hypothetical protein E4634_15975 [Mangrovimicrobium sediminis]|uniref:Uncharacterized protein n=1 Tax=Mangrovimicrobium sediminis TaxID=2562682 RepID=A0A4Z0LY61_9GAMM|nr:hypothetical protein [Haliea sp. SAOS-164]TGD72164.1 hypothetical protein E4634_15975 [Haliea sp. SAOS-164]